MMKISKELFVKTMNEIQEGLKEKEEFNNAMEKFTDTFYSSTIGSKWLEALTNLLSDLVGDRDDGYGTMIDWFLFENVEKKIYFKAKSKFNDTDEEIEIDVSTPELLYDYFEKYCNNDN